MSLKLELHLIAEQAKDATLYCYESMSSPFLHDPWMAPWMRGNVHTSGGQLYSDESIFLDSRMNDSYGVLTHEETINCLNC